MVDQTSDHSFDEKATRHEAVAVDREQVDTAAELVACKDFEDPLEAARVRRKIDLHLMPLMCFLYLYVLRLP